MGSSLPAGPLFSADYMASCGTGVIFGRLFSFPRNGHGQYARLGPQNGFKVAFWRPLGGSRMAFSGFQVAFSLPVFFCFLKDGCFWGPQILFRPDPGGNPEHSVVSIVKTGLVVTREFRLWRIVAMTHRVARGIGPARGTGGDPGQNRFSRDDRIEGGAIGSNALF